jgi:signal transduction histidine kinase
MRLFSKITLSAAPFYASLVVITSLAFFIGIFWAINEYQAYQESIDNIRQNYQAQYEQRLAEELADVVDLIEYRRLQNDLRVERDIRERVQAAYTIASHKYRLYEKDKSVEQLRVQVGELLRPFRWSDGRGYYFAGRVAEGVIDLFADEPFFEGKTAAQFAEITGQNVIADIIAIVTEREAGLYRYNLLKPAFAGHVYPKVAFVKYFEPLDWFIGAGLYNDDLEETLQRDILERIRNIHFGRNGEVFCFRSDGTILSHRDERLIGRSARDLVDSHGQAYGQDFLEIGLNNGEGYVSFAVERESRGTFQQKLGFIKAYQGWGWLIGTSMFMDAMEQAIEAETQTYQRIAFKNVFMFVVMFAIAVFFLLLSTFFYSYKIKQGINLFTNFFRQAADANVKISKEDLVFREFEDLGQLANRMVAERIRNEELLHRDELRLDTLLRLGMMEKYSLQEKYIFILRRLMQITRSSEGYLALVDPSQSEITLCARCHVDHAKQEYQPADEDFGRPRRVEQAGLPGVAALKKTAILVNQPENLAGSDLFPYRQSLHRYLDVPVYSDGRVVLVAGVCDKADRYDNSDIRQMTMLLEGLWMHMQKKASEEELARLERQIIAVSEEERSKIGRDLHDDLGSHLTGVELLSKVLQQKIKEECPARVEQIDTIRNLIREAIEKTRRLSHGLYPVHVVEYGLESAIDELVVEVEKMFAVNFDLLWDGEEGMLGKNTATHLHYIIREAVFNAARHGKPKNIGVYVRVEGSRFSVKIVDDGVGFDTTPAATGMGFHTMKYRAKAIGATLSISSAQDGGTIITVTGEGVE